MFTFACMAGKPHKTKTNQQIEFCPECGRMVYLVSVSVKMGKK